MLADLRRRRQPGTPVQPTFAALVTGALLTDAATVVVPSFVDHPGIGMPKLRGNDRQGHALIASRDAEVCLSPWNEVVGSILATAHAAASGRAWSDYFQGLLPVLRMKRAAWHGLPPFD